MSVCCWGKNSSDLYAVIKFRLIPVKRDSSPCSLCSGAGWSFEEENVTCRSLLCHQSWFIGLLGRYVFKLMGRLILWLWPLFFFLHCLLSDYLSATTQTLSVA